MDLIAILIFVVAFVFSMRFFYRRSTFKHWTNPRPKFVWFPKYIVPFDESIDKLHESLVKHGFEKVEGHERLFKRGKVLGDFSAKYLLLYVEVADDQQSFRLFAGSLVLFDTGDLWQASADILAGSDKE